jgi:GTP-binding protein
VKNIKAEFIKSSSNIKECPEKKLAEFVFLGRSNVGKSSLINMLVNNKKLSKISSKPGKTKLINHFMINDNLFFVDLPGYGWAKASKKDREKWEKMTNEFLLNSKNLVLVFILIDIRISPQKIDINFINYLGRNNIPINIIFTKCDKINTSKINKNINIFNNEILTTWKELPTYFISSSITKNGRDDILNYIIDTNKSLKID